MATELQKTANQRNALMSTGPRSLAGKARSSQNAIRHGMTAQQKLIPGEDPAEFAALRQSMFDSLRPAGVLENQLVERAASLMWRLRRVPSFEVALFQWMAHYQEQLYDFGKDAIDRPDVDRRNDTETAAPDLNNGFDDGLKVGRMFEALLSSDLTSKLTRYETGMQRQLGMTLGELRKLHGARDELSRAVAERLAEEGDNHKDDWVEYEGQKISRMGPP